MSIRQKRSLTALGLRSNGAAPCTDLVPWNHTIRDPASSRSDGARRRFWVLMSEINVEGRGAVHA